MINLEKFQKSARGYRRLEGVTGDFKWLQEVILSGYRGLKGITESYKKIQGITRSYRKLHVQGIRGGCRGRQGIKRGYRGQKDITIHCRGPHMYKRLQRKGVPPNPLTKEKQREGASMKGW